MSGRCARYVPRCRASRTFGRRRGRRARRNVVPAPRLTCAPPTTDSRSADRTEDLALLHFTSGTTGTPKGAMHVHEAVVAHLVTGRARARPPRRRRVLVHRRSRLGHRHVVRDHRAARAGVTSIVDEAEFDAERWYGSSTDRASERLVHGADRDPHADARRRRGAERYDLSRCASSRASASRSTPRRCGGASTPSVYRSTTTGGRPKPAAS